MIIDALLKDLSIGSHSELLLKEFTLKSELLLKNELVYIGNPSMK